MNHFTIIWLISVLFYATKVLSCHNYFYYTSWTIQKESVILLSIQCNSRGIIKTDLFLKFERISCLSISNDCSYYCALTSLLSKRNSVNHKLQCLSQGCKSASMKKSEIMQRIFLKI